MSSPKTGASIATNTPEGSARNSMMTGEAASANVGCAMREIVSGDIQPFSATTIEKMAACHAVGLSYWSDHPSTGCMWAVDESRRAHVVRWYRKTREVALQSVGKPRKVVDYSKVGGLFYKDQYPTYDAGERVKVRHDCFPVHRHRVLLGVGPPR